MLDILIIAHFTQVPGKISNGRFHYIAETLKVEGTDVEVVTTSFSHGSKKQRNITEKQKSSLKYKLTILHEPGYSKNVTLSRFYSHYIFGRNLKKYLNRRKKPDVIFCAVPSLDAALTAAKYANENNIRFIIDIQDLWPEAFNMVFNVPIVSDVLFYPMKGKADYIYARADEIVAVSQTYANRALKVNKKCIEGHSVFLGTELRNFDMLVEKNKYVKKPKEEFWIGYIGTLGNSYDIGLVIDAIFILKEKGINNLKFVVMGDGPLKSNFEAYADMLNIYCEFTGKLEYDRMVSVLKFCDVALNPIKPKSASSIINKVGDYAAAGIPVINTQENEEYRKLLNEYNAGLNCRSNTPEELAENILMLYHDENLRREMGTNNRTLAEQMFNRAVTYKEITELVVK